MTNANDPHQHFARLLKAAEALDPMATAVVAPEEGASLSGAVLAAEKGLIKPILIGDTAKIKAAAEADNLDISSFEIVDEANHKEAASKAVAMVHEGRVSAVMKGHLHTDELLGQVVKRDGGLRIGRRLSHVFVTDVPGFERLLLITDAALNIAPDVATKAHIVQNALELAANIGIAEPKAAMLSAVETVNEAIPSSVEAAEIVKMAEAGEITGGLVGGPFAMDNAISVEAAKLKGVSHPVAGNADILVVPTIEAGNMLFKGLTYLAGAEVGGIVLGAKCPVILTSRADGVKSRLASCAVAALHAAKS